MSKSKHSDAKQDKKMIDKSIKAYAKKDKKDDKAMIKKAVAKVKKK